MIVYFGMTYTVEQSGRVIRNVTCEKCSVEYVYPYETKSTGIAESMYFLNNQGAKDRAAKAAMDDLERKMTKGVRIVPCLQCGHIQPEMVAKLRRKRKQLYKDIGYGLTFLILLLAAICIMCIPSGLPILAAVTAFTALLVVVGKVILHSWGEKYPDLYDPNASTGKQKHQYIPEVNAMLKSDYENMLAEREKQLKRDKLNALDVRSQLDEIAQQTKLDNEMRGNYQRENGRQSIPVAKPVKDMPAPHGMAEIITTTGEIDLSGSARLPENSGVCHIHCVHCDNDYVYFLKPVDGQQQSSRTHELFPMNDGSTTLQKRIVPCPKCRNIQPDMVKKLRRDYFIAFLIIGYLVCIMFVIIYFKVSEVHQFRPVPLTFGVIAVAVITAILITIVGRWLANQRDPNADPDKLHSKYSYYESMLRSKYDRLVRKEAVWKLPEPEFNIELSEPADPR